MMTIASFTGTKALSAGKVRVTAASFAWTLLLEAAWLCLKSTQGLTTRCAQPCTLICYHGVAIGGPVGA
jgi:hypothetical protein